ncbi:MAG: hypothetical protein N2689_07925 [Verrucomicrobiae bacterium]|nr:hypothetical protein [Verrucomicrobiae bacterium]
MGSGSASSNDITRIWRMFDGVNQPLITLALVVGTGHLVNHAVKPTCALISALPVVFMAAKTPVAGYYNIFSNFRPKAAGRRQILFDPPGVRGKKLVSGNM